MFYCVPNTHTDVSVANQMKSLAPFQPAVGSTKPSGSETYRGESRIPPQYRAPSLPPQQPAAPYQPPAAPHQSYQTPSNKPAGLDPADFMPVSTCTCTYTCTCTHVPTHVPTHKPTYVMLLCDLMNLSFIIFKNVLFC